MLTVPRQIDGKVATQAFAVKRPSCGVGVSERNQITGFHFILYKHIRSQTSPLRRPLGGKLSNTKASSKVLEVDTDARYTFHEVNKSLGLPHMASQAIFHQRADSSPPGIKRVQKARV